jgi:hypothetical protein
MIGDRSNRAILLALLGAGLVAAWPDAARAQCRLCEVPTTAPDSDGGAAPLRLEVQTRLDFDRIVFAGLGQGSIGLAPDGQTRPTGAVAAVGARAMPGSVVIRGEPGRAVRIDLPRTVRLYGESGGLVVINSLVTDLPSFAQIGRDGLLSFRFGGELEVSGDSDGAFRGDIDIIVEYL